MIKTAHTLILELLENKRCKKKKRITSNSFKLFSSRSSFKMQPKFYLGDLSQEGMIPQSTVDKKERAVLAIHHTVLTNRTF